MPGHFTSASARTRQLLPSKSGAHRIACLALYRALLQQCTRIPLPSDLPRAGPVNPIKHLIRKRFKKDAPICSPRLAVNALKVGYAAKKLLRTAGDGSDPSLSKIHTLLHLQHARSEASRVTYKAAPTPKAPRVGPYPGAPKLVDVRPLPLEKLYGRRHVPTLTHANGYPFLRTSKPQSAFLSRMLRNKIDSKDQRHKRLQNYEKDVEVGKDEEAWEGLVGRVLEREVGIWAREEWMGSEDRDSGQVRGSWFEESLRAKEEVKYYLWEDLQKAKKLGDRMTEVVESERRLWWQERGRRRIEKKAAKKEKGGLVGAEALDEDRR